MAQFHMRLFSAVVWRRINLTRFMF